MQVSRFAFRLLPIAVATAAAAGISLSGSASAQPAGSAAPAASALPAASNTGGVTQIVVSGGARALFKIAVAPLPGDASISGSVTETAGRDFTLSSLFQVLDPKSFTANLEKEGLAIDPASWRTIGAEGVVKGNSAMRGDKVHLELRLYVVSRGSDAVLKKEYDVLPSALRGAVHQFDNEVVKYFTGTASNFGSRLVFSATTGRGQKGIFGVDSDGQGLGRMTAVSNVALAPAVGPGGIYYAGGLADGSYQLFKLPGTTPVMKQPGLVFGVAFGGGAAKMAVAAYRPVMTSEMPTATLVGSPSAEPVKLMIPPKPWASKSYPGLLAFGPVWPIPVIEQ